LKDDIKTVAVSISKLLHSFGVLSDDGTMLKNVPARKIVSALNPVALVINPNYLSEKFGHFFSPEFFESLARISAKTTVTQKQYLHEPGRIDK
jgi:hypothetical protein